MRTTAPLDVVLRTHSTSNVHGGERYVGAPKHEVMLRCSNSLVIAINAAEADIRLWVVDDGSTPEVRSQLEEILARCRYPTALFPMIARIQNESTLAQFALGRQHARDLVYFVEDDYLHAPSAISEMLETYALFSGKLAGDDVALHPYDDPNNYTSEGYNNELCRVVLGPRRHWRTNTHTTNTVCLPRRVLERHWDKFEFLANHYGITPGTTEHNTINRIWREDVRLFSPIPSIALHLQYHEHKDPYIDWRAWWDAAAY